MEEKYVESLQYIRDIPLSKSFNKDIIEEVLEFQPKDGDIIIASYPKTGTTWVQYIVLQILTKAEYFPSFEELLYNAMPFLEITGVTAVESSTRKPRIYKHHMPYTVMKKNPNAKIIYTYRKPEDTLVSYYHFLKEMYTSLDLDEHFKNFMNGSISYGLYFEHILSYLEHKPGGNILFVSYEKLKNQTKEELLRVARFLGEEYFDALVDCESILYKIIENTSFEHMKKNLPLSASHHHQKEHSRHYHSKEDVNASKRQVNFFRKGIVGDGKNTLKEKQLQQIRKLAENLMKETDIFKEWYNG